MITITDRAAEKARAAIDGKSDNPIGLRVSIKGGGCSGFTYSLGFAYDIDEHDKIIEDNGITLVIDRKSRLYLFGTELDWHQDELMGGGFAFNNPNAKRTCGCGESFSV